MVEERVEAEVRVAIRELEEARKILRKVVMGLRVIPLGERPTAGEDYANTAELAAGYAIEEISEWRRG